MQITMTIEQILAQLDTVVDTLPREALTQAQARREEMTPHLLAILEKVLAAPTEVPDGYFGLHSATYLLAAFREPLAFPLFLKLCHLPSKVSDELYGETVTEDMPRILAAVCGQDADSLCALFADGQANEYIRASATKALAVMWLDGRLSQLEMENIFLKLLRNHPTDDDSYAITGLVDTCLDLGPAPFLTEIEGCFERDQIEPFAFGRDSLHRALKWSPDENRSRMAQEHYAPLIVDVADEFEGWAWFVPKQQPSDFGKFDAPPRMLPTLREPAQTGGGGYESIVTAVPVRQISSKDKAVKKSKRAMAKQSRKKNRR